MADSSKQYRLVAATFTPFNRKGGLELSAVSEHVESLLTQGVEWAFVCGTTGEGSSLTGVERRAVLEAFVEASGGRLSLIAHIGHPSIVEARELAGHAEACGVEAVAALSPYFFKPRGVDDLVDACEEIASGAPDTPFLFYHMPSNTGVDLKMAPYFRKATERVATFAGIKFTHEDLFDFSACLDIANDRSQMYFGRDEILLAAVSMGAVSAVGTTYSVAARLYFDLLAAVDADDDAGAQEWQRVSRSIIQVAGNHGGLPALKAMMRFAGVDVGGTRRPLARIDDDEISAIRQELLDIGALRYLGAA